METHTNGVAYVGVESKFKELHPVTSSATPYTVLPTPYTVLLCFTLYSFPPFLSSLLPPATCPRRMRVIYVAAKKDKFAQRVPQERETAPLVALAAASN